MAAIPHSVMFRFYHIHHLFLRISTNLYSSLFRILLMKFQFVPRSCPPLQVTGAVTRLTVYRAFTHTLKRSWTPIFLRRYPGTLCEALLQKRRLKNALILEKLKTGQNLLYAQKWNAKLTLARKSFKHLKSWEKNLSSFMVRSTLDRSSKIVLILEKLKIGQILR